MMCCHSVATIAGLSSTPCCVIRRMNLASWARSGISRGSCLILTHGLHWQNTCILAHSGWRLPHHVAGIGWRVRLRMLVCGYILLSLDGRLGA